LKKNVGERLKGGIMNKEQALKAIGCSEDLLKNIRKADLETLIYYSKNVFCGNIAKDLIKKRMAQLLLQLIPQIDNFEKFYFYWHCIPDDCKARDIIEAGMEDFLSKVDNFNELISYRSRAKVNSTLRDLINKKIGVFVLRVLPNIFNFEDLHYFWREVSRGSGIESLIEERMVGFLSKILAGKIDLKRLIFLLYRVPRMSDSESMIERKMEILLKNISDFKELVEYWRMIPGGSRARVLVEKRICELE